MTFPNGTRLGPYEIVAPIGAGGMGEVYRGRDTRLDRSVAIKVLASPLAAKLDIRERFEREAKAISSISHAHICTLYDLGHENGTDFLVMEYLEGETLAHRLTRGPLPIEQSSIWIAKRGSTERRKLTQASARPIFVNGYLLYSREKTLLAQKFDPVLLKLTGDPAPLAEQLQYIAGTATGVFSASSTGMLGYAQGGTKSQLVWYDRAGRETGRLGAPADYLSVALSPDGHRVASTIVESTGRSNVWIHETGHAAPARFTFQTYDQMIPAWSPDGTQIAYGVRNAPPGLNIVLKNSSGTTPEQPLWSSPDVQKVALDWSRDGRYLLVMFHSPKQKVIYDIWLYSIADRKATPLVQSRHSEIQGSFAPDAKWFVYCSNESGRYQVYAQPVRGGSKLQISSAGGFMPKWSRDGREIFYVTPARKLMAVPVKERDSTLEVGDPQPLFDTHLRVGNPYTTYAVTSDGQRFLMCATEDSATTPITLIANWMSLVERR